MTRTSRPAWMAKARSTPGKLVATCSRSSRRWTYDSSISRRAPGRWPDSTLAASTMWSSTSVGGTSPWCAAIAWHDARRLAVLARDGGADGGVRPLGLLVDGLADVVQQAGAPRGLHRQAQLGRHGAGQEADLDRVLQQVLRVARAELELADQAHQLGVQPRQAQIEGRLLARLLALLLDLRGGLLDHLLDARRVDAPVGDEAGERQPRDLAPHRVEAGDDHRLGRVVDDEVDAGGRLERADVAPLAADDAALHVVGGQRHRRPPCARRRTRRRSAGRPPR